MKNENAISYFFLIFLPIIGQASELEKFQARPDQVLVLYNEDWKKDVDESLPGQDSREVAEYYRERHTDSSRGLKPYLLGLKCNHGQKHLNNWYIEEKSQDNKNGVVFKGAGLPPGNSEWAKDSRHVEIVVEDEDEEGNVDWNSIRIWCSSFRSKERINVNPIVSGIPVNQGIGWVYPLIKNGKGRCLRFDAHELFHGTVWVYLEAKDNNGKKIRELKLKYYDRDDFEFSLTGQDGIVDEKHFQEDIAIPVKRFLEDPENALPDGTFLKDHILYIVICHGLPFSSEGVFGIERGATHNQSDHGDLGSLEQRLQTLYYGFSKKMQPPVISMYMSGGPDSQKGVRSYRITTAMRYPMYGKRWNIYMHPDTYSYLWSEKKAIGDYAIPSFAEARKKAPEYFFGYGVCRIDGQGPLEAKRLVDYAVYASKYLRPEMFFAHRPLEDNTKETDKEPNIANVYQGENWGLGNIPELGFENVPGQKEQGIPFLKFNQDISLNHFRYLPGGMDRVVESANGWNFSRNEQIWKQVDEGVTISACGGPAYGGGPHITNASFWDNRILMRYLFRGRDLGECFLLSTYYVNWSTSLVGDPLYHPDLSQTIVDSSPPSISGKDDIQIALFPTMEKYSGVIKVPVRFSSENPEVSLLNAFFKKDGEDVERSASSSIFSAQPRVVIRDLEPDSNYLVRLVLTDPYGNRSDLSDVFGHLKVSVGGGNKQMPVWRQAVKKKDNWIIVFHQKGKLSEQGTIEVRFKAGKDGLLPSIEGAGMDFKAKNYSSKGKSLVSFKIGGVERWRVIASLLAQGENATLLVRWRRYPLTREVILKANDGTQFPLIADNRTPWEKMSLSDTFKIIEGESVNVLFASMTADADTASEGAVGVELIPLKNDAWGEAQNRIR